MSDQHPQYQVGDVVNGHRWTGAAWEPVADVRSTPQPQPQPQPPSAPSASPPPPPPARPPRRRTHRHRHRQSRWRTGRGSHRHRHRQSRWRTGRGSHRHRHRRPAGVRAGAATATDTAVPLAYGQGQPPPPPPPVPLAYGPGQPPPPPVPLAYAQLPPQPVRPAAAPPPQRSATVALLMAVLLGWLGVHRFYLRMPATAILQLLTLGGLLVWTSIDIAMILNDRMRAWAWSGIGPKIENGPC